VYSGVGLRENLSSSNTVVEFNPVKMGAFQTSPVSKDSHMSQSTETIIVGGGQAGLATSDYLAQLTHADC
jgi:ribulose 1,5-bisphosphate synthetase/thiazole synthase